MPTTGALADSAILYFQVQAFYSRQLRYLDGGQVEEFANTFTEDGYMRHLSRDDRIQGREALKKSIDTAWENYRNVVPRHWFDKLDIHELEDGTIHVSYYALLTSTHPNGKVTVEPTCLVDDVLVRDGETFLTRSRTIARDDLLLSS